MHRLERERALDCRALRLPAPWQTARTMEPGKAQPRAPENGYFMPTDSTVLDHLTADLFDLDATTVDGNLLAVDADTDNGCGTQPACRYPDTQN